MTTAWSLLAGVVALAGGLSAARSAEQPLPSADAVKMNLAKRLKEDRREKAVFEQRYRFVRSRVREERNTRGKLRKRDEERVVSDPRQQDRDAAGRAVETKYGERDVRVDQDLLDRFVFEVDGRETVDGRAAVRVKFRPSGDDLPQHNTLDRFINRMAGTLWLEESTLTLLRGQLGLLEEVKFFGGIAGVVYRLDISWERAFTPEGIRYTRRGAWHADYRTFLVRKVVEFEERREEIECVVSETASP